MMTANLDGETSHKTRVSSAVTKQAKTTKQISSLTGCIECENHNPKLDSFLSRLTLWSCQEEVEPEVSALGNENLHKGTDLYLFSLGQMLHFLGANKETFFNKTNIKRPEHRDNLPSLMGYEVAKDYPQANYIQNERVWYLDQLVEITRNALAVDGSLQLQKFSLHVRIT